MLLPRPVDEHGKNSTMTHERIWFDSYWNTKHFERLLPSTKFLVWVVMVSLDHRVKTDQKTRRLSWRRLMRID